MQNLEAHKLIEASPLFRNLQPQEIARILARLQPVSVSGGTRILERGIWHGQLYIIESGQVSVLLDEGREGSEGSEEDHDASDAEALAVAHLGPGECFGEMSLITGEPPSATVRSEQETLLWALPQTDFLTLLGECPTLTRNINAMLSLRLARTNRQILLKHSAERIWIADLGAGPSDTRRERALIPHIANALAVRSRKRVLVLELCAPEEAASPHFATHQEQLRPSLLECARDHSLLTRHRAPTMSGDGRPYAAFATLFAAFATPPAEQDAQALLTDLGDLAALYDYLLLVSTPMTPGALVRATAKQASRALLLVPASMGEEVKQFLAHTKGLEHTVFVTHVPERPTISAQDRYAARLGLPVTRLVPANDALLAACWEQRATLSEVAPDADIARGVDFVARSIARQTVGIAFGGGGARGFAHLGVLERLLAHHVPLDYIAACSSGIIAPGMYLLGKSFPESEDIFLQIQRNIVRWHIPRTSLFSNAGLKRMLRDLCGETRFEDLETPFAMVAVDLSIRAGVVLDRGLLWQAGLASTALPGVFPPVLAGDHILMDAGMHDPVPIRLVRQMGAGILIASELGGQEPPALTRAASWLGQLTPTPPGQQGRRERLQEKRLRTPTIGDLLLRTYDLAMATIGMHSIREADIVIRPRLYRVSLRQFSEGRKFVAAGHEAVEQSLPQLQAHLPWLI
jgi:NTE family protein